VVGIAQASPLSSQTYAPLLLCRNPTCPWRGGDGFIDTCGYNWSTVQFVRKITGIGLWLHVIGAVLVLLAPALAWARPSSRLPTSQAGSIAYVGTDGNIYLWSAQSEQRRCVSCSGRSEQVRAQGIVPVSVGLERIQDEPGQPPTLTAPRPRFRLPTFSPDATQLAYTSMRMGRDGITFAVHVSDLAKRQSNELFSGPIGRPIDLHWSAGSHRLFFLVEHQGLLSLMLVRTDRPAPARLLAQGQPLFFAWNEARKELALNYAPSDQSEQPQPQRVVLMEVSDQSQHVSKVLSASPGLFRTPAWSPNGAYLAWVNDKGNGQAALIVAASDGTQPREMVGLPPFLSTFVWSPDSKQIAFTSAQNRRASSFDGIGLLDLASGNISTLVSGPVTSYSFAPDGRHLAYVVPEGAGYSWYLTDLPPSKPRRLQSFLPTQAEDLTLRFFDHSPLSGGIWSPDSRHLTFAGALLAPGQQEENALPPPQVWIVSLDNQPAMRIGDGSMSTWSPVASPSPGAGR